MHLFPSYQISQKYSTRLLCKLRLDISFIEIYPVNLNQSFVYYLASNYLNIIYTKKITHVHIIHIGLHNKYLIIKKFDKLLKQSDS